VRLLRALAYARGVREADAALGELLAGVRARVEGPVLVAVAADHGEALDEHLAERGYAWDHGEYLDPEQIRIPLVLAGAGIQAGRSSSPASIRDLYGTFLAAAGVEDAQAATEGRRDLRRPSTAARVVAAERRGLEDASIGSPDARTSASVRAHAAAATDGRSFVVVGEDGSPTLSSDGPEPALVEAALSLARTQRPGRAAPPLDPATRDALRSLGYAP
jgi:arylsulfatase A-like enzyme